jgi:hypothetical protein
MNEDNDLSKTFQSSSKTFTSASQVRITSSIGGKNKNPSDCEAKKASLKVHRQCIIQLKTVPEGYNLGRIYYLKTNIDTPDRLIIKHLSEARTKAKGKAERKSKFQRSQDMMRTVQESLVFQIIVAVLILLVRALFVGYITAPKGLTDTRRLSFYRTFWSTLQSLSSRTPSSAVMGNQLPSERAWSTSTPSSPPFSPPSWPSTPTRTGSGPSRSMAGTSSTPLSLRSRSSRWAPLPCP